MKSLQLLLFWISFPIFVSAQYVMVEITLYANEGGVHSLIQVDLVNTSTGESFHGKTDANGIVLIAVAGNATYELQIPNYTTKEYIDVPDAPGQTMTASFFYSRNMKAQDAAFEMDEAEKAEVDRFANALDDTTWFKVGNPFKANSHSYYSDIELEVKDFNGRLLNGEIVTLIARKRNKIFKGVTGADGKLKLKLPKGDNYDLSFHYHADYESIECKYSKGTSEIKWSFEYFGTKKIEQQKKEEAERQAAEIVAIAQALAQAKIDSVNYIAQRKIDSINSIAYAKAQRVKNLLIPYSENNVAAVFDRNKYANPLVICDASAQMTMIVDELQLWFGKNSKAHPASQFVFFNDGDKKSERDKKIGETGGFYYTPALPLDKLMVFIDIVLAKGNDFDAQDNYVEALIKGVQMAKQPYSDIVLIVDNHATPRDMILLPQFTGKPVHVVVFCSIKGGCDHSMCQPDYLKIAYKTKGTLSIDGIDYNNIANMKNGDVIEVTGARTKYKLMNGAFFRM